MVPPSSKIEAQGRMLPPRRSAHHEDFVLIELRIAAR